MSKHCHLVIETHEGNLVQLSDDARSVQAAGLPTGQFGEGRQRAIIYVDFLRAGTSLCASKRNRHDGKVIISTGPHSQPGFP